MAVNFTSLYVGTHQYKDGTVEIIEPFSGNTLAIELTTKPEYVESNQVIGYLFQVKGSAQKAYTLRSGKDVVKLDLPETDKLLFSPTRYLTDSYTLTIGYTDVGSVSNGSINLSIPEQILELPARVETLENATLSVSWDEVTDKPLSFNPSIHGHEISDVSGLTTALNNKASASHLHGLSDVTGLTNTLSSKADVGHTHSVSDVTGLSATLSGISNELAFVDGRLDTLEAATPSSPSFTLKEQVVNSFALNASTSLTDVSLGVIGIYEEVVLPSTRLSPNNLTSNTSDPNFIVDQSSAYDASYNGFRLFNGVLNSEPDWCTSGGVPQWVSMAFDTAKTIGSYSLTPSDVSVMNSNTPRNFTLQGSTDGSNWINLDSQSNVSSWVGGTAKTFVLATPANYRYYRLLVTQTSGGSLVRLGELALFSPASTDGYISANSNYSIAFNSNYSSQTIKKISGTNSKTLIKYL